MGAGGRIETVFRSCTEDTILATREDYGLTEPTPPEIGRPSWAMLTASPVGHLYPSDFRWEAETPSTGISIRNGEVLSAPNSGIALALPPGPVLGAGVGVSSPLDMRKSKIT